MTAMIIIKDGAVSKAPKKDIGEKK